MVAPARDIAWSGFYNARDLGDLPTRDGGVTRSGAFIRSADLRFVTADAWRDAYDAGVRTVIDLRNDDEVHAASGVGPTALVGSAQFAPEIEGPSIPSSIRRIHVPLDGVEDVELWRYLNEERLNGTPLYYRPFLERKPDRVAAAMTAMVNAEPGGVIFHCGGGRDRTGLVALLLLGLVGVDVESIADDYERSAAQLPALLRRMGRGDGDLPLVAEALASKGMTEREAIRATLADLDVEAYLRRAGVDVERLRARFLRPLSA